MSSFLNIETNVYFHFNPHRSLNRYSVSDKKLLEKRKIKTELGINYVKIFIKN